MNDVPVSQDDGLITPNFAAAEINPFSFVPEPEEPEYLTRVSFADIDGDGDEDAFIGLLNGSTLFFENIGSIDNPSFAVEQTNPFGLTDVAWLASPSFADIAFWCIINAQCGWDF